MAFGEVTPFGQGMTGGGQSVFYQNTQISIHCSNNTPYQVLLTAVPGMRTLKGTGTNTDKIQYALCKTAFPCTSGNITNDQIFITDIGNGTTQLKTLYGTAKAGYYQPDNYSDTITLIVKY